MRLAGSVYLGHASTRVCTDDGVASFRCFRGDHSEFLDSAASDGTHGVTWSARSGHERYVSGTSG